MKKIFRIGFEIIRNMDHLEGLDSETVVRDATSEAIREDTEKATTVQVDESCCVRAGTSKMSTVISV